MAFVIFPCDCGATLRLPAGKDGSVVTCPKCGRPAYTPGAKVKLDELVKEPPQVKVQPPPVPRQDDDEVDELRREVRRLRRRVEDHKEDELPRAQKKKPKTVGPFGVFVAMVVAVLVFIMCTGGRDGGNDADTALFVARDAVRKQLLAPADAEFPAFGHSVTPNGENKWIVRGEVDAKNRLGVRVRHRWEVSVEKTGGGWRWFVESLR